VEGRLEQQREEPTVKGVDVAVASHGVIAASEVARAPCRRVKAEDASPERTHAYLVHPRTLEHSELLDIGGTAGVCPLSRLPPML
jgi:hypothetical protein